MRRCRRLRQDWCYCNAKLTGRSSQNKQRFTRISSSTWSPCSLSCRSQGPPESLFRPCNGSHRTMESGVKLRTGVHLTVARFCNSTPPDQDSAVLHARQHNTKTALTPSCRRVMAMDSGTPQPGQWPVDPQEDEPQVLKERMWVDGCFDFAHHGKSYNR